MVFTNWHKLNKHDLYEGSWSKTFDHRVCDCVCFSSFAMSSRPSRVQFYVGVFMSECWHHAAHEIKWCFLLVLLLSELTCTAFVSAKSLKAFRNSKHGRHDAQCSLLFLLFTTFFNHCCFRTLGRSPQDRSNDMLFHSSRVRYLLTGLYSRNYLT